MEMQDTEEGEICDPDVILAAVPTSSHSERKYGYDPSLEWPGDEDEFQPLPVTQAHPSRSSGVGKAVCRFIVLKTSVLPPKHRIAVIDGYKEVQFGRDAPTIEGDTPRIRLKEMEVCLPRAEPRSHLTTTQCRCPSYTLLLIGILNTRNGV
jgi:hypothetical protein